MSDKFTKALMRVGLDLHEASLYITMLKNKPNSILKIASLADMDRMTTHRTIHRLVDKKIVGVLQKGKRKVYYANKPESLERLLDFEIHRIEEKKQTLKELLPDIEELYFYSSKEPDIHYFRGSEGLKHALLLILKEMSKARDKLIRVFVPKHHFLDSYFEQVYPSFFKKQYQNNIRVKVLAPFSTKSSFKVRELEEIFTQRRYMLSNSQFQCVQYILEKSVYYLFLEEDFFKIVSIDYPMLVSTQKNIFDFAWEYAKPISYNGKEL